MRMFMTIYMEYLDEVVYFDNAGKLIHQNRCN